MRDIIISGIKTGVQVVVAAAVAWLLTNVGLDLSGVADQIELGLFAVLTAVVTGVLNWLGEKFPWLNSILSLGTSRSTASY